MWRVAEQTCGLFLGVFTKPHRIGNFVTSIPFIGKNMEVAGIEPDSGDARLNLAV